MAVRLYNGIDLAQLAYDLLSLTGSYKPIPKGSSVAVVIPSGTAAGQEFSPTAEPDDGYVFDITYMKLTVPDGIEANVIVTTDEGDTSLLANNATSDTVIDASDFGGLSGIKKITLYAKVVTPPSSDVTPTLEFGGKQVKVGGA